MLKYEGIHTVKCLNYNNTRMLTSIKMDKQTLAKIKRDHKCLRSKNYVYLSEITLDYLHV